MFTKITNTRVIVLYLVHESLLRRILPEWKIRPSIPPCDAIPPPCAPLLGFLRWSMSFTLEYFSTSPYLHSLFPPSSHFRLLRKVIGYRSNLRLMDTWQFLPVQVIGPFWWLSLLYFCFLLSIEDQLCILWILGARCCVKHISQFSAVSLIPLDNINLASIVALTISPPWFDLCTKEIAFSSLPIKRWMQFLSQEWLELLS